MKCIFSIIALALLSLDPLAVVAQRFTKGQQGCPLDLAAKVAAEVKCGKKSTVAFAVEWYGTDAAQLERWFRLAGCGDGEAATEAVRVLDYCKSRALVTGLVVESLEIRQVEHVPARRLTGKRALDLRRAHAHNKRDDSDDTDSTTSSTSTTLSTSTTSSTTTTPTSTSPTSSNPYVVTHISGTSTSIMTCMTMTTKLTQVCSTHTSNKKHISSCTSTPVSFPTCLPGIGCSFDQNVGTLSCYEKGNVPVYGRVILAIMGLFVFVSLTAIITLCCRERSQTKQHRQAAEEKALLAGMEANKNAGVTVEELGVLPAGAEARESQPNTTAAHGDHAPLIHSEEASHAASTPQIVIDAGGHTPAEEAANFPPGRYDPFADDDHHHHAY